MLLKVIGTGSKGNAYLLKNEEEAILIECGVNIKNIKIALNFDFSKVIGCLLTHEHNDHKKCYQELMQNGVDIYASSGTWETIYNNKEKHQRAKTITNKTKFKLGNYTIMPFDVKHDATEPFGFLIYHIECGYTLFLTDTYFCKYVFPNLNNIIIEANYSKKIIDKKYLDTEFLKNRVLRSHFSLENCLEMLLKHDLTNVNNIILIHLSESNSNAKEFKELTEKQTNKKVTIASNEIEIDLNKTPI